MSTDPGVTELVDLAAESGLATVSIAEDFVHGVVEMHLKIASRLRREGATLRSFQELERASSAAPMSPRLAAGLVSHGSAAGAQAAARSLLTGGLEEVEGAGRLAVLRQLARLAWRMGDLDEVRHIHSGILAQFPEDRRSRAALNAALARSGRWQELDASLKQETRLAIRRGQLKRASRSALRRARLWAEALADSGRAATCAQEAAECAEQAGDLQSAFPLRLLWLRSLSRAKARLGDLQEAAKAVLRMGERVSQSSSARSLVQELGLGREGTTPDERTPRRASSQSEWIAVADAAEVAGRKPEAAALLAAAVREGPDPVVAQRLEAHLIQRGAWRELASFYQDMLSQVTTNAERAKWAEKSAELLESEIKDVAGAASAWAEVASATGDPRAWAEQARLLGQRNEAAEPRTGQSQAERAKALVLQAREAHIHGDLGAARAHLEAALKVSPSYAEAAADLAELGALQGDLRPIRLLEQALTPLPRHAAGRGDLYRRLARLSDSRLRDAGLSRGCWLEVLAEFPHDEEASARLRALTRASGDDATLEQLLSEALARESSGARARQLRMELVTLLERGGRKGEALELLQHAVRIDPQHREGWLAYAERLMSLGHRDPEAAVALDHAARATEDPSRRLRLYQRLARFVRTRLGDEAAAKDYEQRAEVMVREAQGRGPPPPELLPGGPLVIPHRGLKPQSPSERQRLAAERASLDQLAPVEVYQESRDHIRIAPRVERQLRTLLGGPMLLPRPEHPNAAPPTSATRSKAGASFGPSPSRALEQERGALFEHVRNDPLDADRYRLLAEHFDTASDPARASLMLEIARALEGDPHAAPRSPRLILNAKDRAGLIYPSLRSGEGELLTLVGIALCRLNPSPSEGQEFQLGAGKGARPVADALLAAVRILGVRAPDVYVSDAAGPPLSVIFTTEARILVGKVALKKEIAGAELRFFAGRALFTLQPDLLVLRSLRRDQLSKGLALVSQVAQGKASPPEAKFFREQMSAQAWDRFKQLAAALGPQLDLASLAEAARHSSNRAGLVVCGGIAPALASLRAKKALPHEITELVRFAASERYLQLRNRNLPKA